MLPLCREEGLGVIPWSPLARGLLTGSRGRDLSGDTVRAGSDSYAPKLYDESDWAVVERVLEVAERRGAAPATVALAWLLHQEDVTAPIIGATRLEHLDDAVAAVHLELDDDERARLEEPYIPHPVRGHE